MAAVACHFGRKILLNSRLFPTYALHKTVPVLNATRTLHFTSVLFGSGVLKKDENPQNVSREKWLKRLSPEQFYVCRERGTEMPFSGEHLNNDESGTYTCVCCGTPLFSSSTKFESGSGWPSFYDVITPEGAAKSNVRSRRDSSHGMFRTEVMCRKCDSHLGHVFNDGPAPTGLRYCINSVTLEFEESSGES